MEQKTRIRNKIISSVVTLLLVFSIFLCLSVVVQLLNKGYVSLFGNSYFRVITGSMEPEIKVGELIHTKKTDMATLKEGEIVSFKSVSSDSYGAIITHRIVGISRGSDGILLLTKGDANLSADGEYVTKDNYIGKVVWRSGDDSFAADFMAFITSKNAFLICIVFPCLLVCGFILKDGVSKMNKELEAIKNAEKKRKTEECGEDPCDVSGGDESAEDSEDYERMRERIRAELIEELKNSDEQGQ